LPACARAPNFIDRADKIGTSAMEADVSVSNMDEVVELIS